LPQGFLIQRIFVNWDSSLILCSLETDIQITTKLVAKDLLLEADDRIFHSLEQLQSWLSEQIAHMMELEFERLLSTLYRIDVDEQRAKLAIAGDHPSWELAGLIIERELKKVETRKRYRNFE
jgi:hypothetical protein